MMRKFFLASAAIAALSTTAFAADLPSRRAPPVYIPPPIPVFSWTGFYVGGQVGYDFGQTTVNTTVPAVPPFFPGLAASQTAHPHGVIGGGHVGYNFAGIPGFGLGTGGLVFGVEGDFDGTDYRSSTTFGPGNPTGLAVGSTATVRKDYEASARGRLGVAVDRALFYATGGVAFGEFHESVNNVGVGFNSFSQNRVGYTVGGGVEYAITTNWSLRAEYRYTDFGTFTDNLTNASLVPGTNNRIRETENRAQVGFSYKFDTVAPIPVVARY